MYTYYIYIYQYIYIYLSIYIYICSKEQNQKKHLLLHVVLATNARKIQQMQLSCCRQCTSVLTIRLTQTLTSIWCMHWFRSYLEPLHRVVWCLCRLSLACRSSWCFHWAEKISVVDSMIWIHFHCSPTHGHASKNWTTTQVWSNTFKCNIGRWIKFFDLGLRRPTHWGGSEMGKVARPRV